jgi:RNA polymerase sigma-70 factor, ECF subfamily
MNDPVDLERLMCRYQAGEIEAFDDLYAALAAPLFQYLASLSHDGTLARDLLQDTFLQIHRARRSYRPGLPVRPWVFAIARHVWLMDRRTRARRPAANTELMDLPVPADVERLADKQMLARTLAQVLPDRREALLLHHVWGFTFAEIGQLLGIREEAAKLRSSRGMSDLRKKLGGTD